MSGLIAIDRRGTSRLTIKVGPWAIKVARNAAGLRCNRREAECWKRTTPARRAMLCPVLMTFPLGIAIVMQRVESLPEHEANHLRRTRGFPDWNYAGPDDEECPFEHKASDWGRLDGRLVALDYSGDPDDARFAARAPSAEMLQEFISEDDLETFAGWLRYQAVDPATATSEELAMLRGLFDEGRKLTAGAPKVGLMKLRPLPGEHRFAVAVRDGSDLWLALWVRRSRKGEFFVIVPRNDRESDIHSSYHLDGTFHMKSYGRPVAQRKKQPLTGPFRGTEHLGAQMGYAPKGVGAICDPAAFSGVMEVPPGLLGPRDGQIVVDLVEPDCEPISWPFRRRFRQEVFRDVVPWVVIRVGS
jgi:hypothetical protein